MHALSMGVMPGPLGVRVLLQEGPERTLLKAVLPCAPKDPRALELLCQALARWCARPLRVALCADDSEILSDTSPWLGSLEDGSPHFELRVVVGHDAATDEGAGGEPGEFDDVRAFLRRWAAP